MFVLLIGKEINFNLKIYVIIWDLFSNLMKQILKNGGVSLIEMFSGTKIIEIRYM